MSDNNSIIGTQLKNLLGVVDEYRAKQCGELISNANQQAAEIIRQAYRESRQRVHLEIQQSRKQARQHIASAEAQVKTRQRHLRQQSDKEILEKGWKLLQEQLLYIWEQEMPRTRWLNNLMHTACASLNNNEWRIEHPRNLPAKELAQMTKRITEHTGHKPVTVANPSLAAGMRIFCDSACIDGTLQGLMSHKDLLEGMLLNEISMLKEQQE
jgi:hypothetical protein